MFHYHPLASVEIVPDLLFRLTGDDSFDINIIEDVVIGYDAVVCHL